MVKGVHITNKAMILHVHEIREWVWGMMLEEGDPDIAISPFNSGYS
jgi:hypothetical protein